MWIWFYSNHFYSNLQHLINSATTLFNSATSLFYSRNNFYNTIQFSSCSNKLQTQSHQWLIAIVSANDSLCKLCTRLYCNNNISHTISASSIQGSYKKSNCSKHDSSEFKFTAKYLFTSLASWIDQRLRLNSTIKLMILQKNIFTHIYS